MYDWVIVVIAPGGNWYVIVGADGVNLVYIIVLAVVIDLMGIESIVNLIVWIVCLIDRLNLMLCGMQTSDANHCGCSLLICTTIHKHTWKSGLEILDYSYINYNKKFT